jgi:hypothetical protein
VEDTRVAVVKELLLKGNPKKLLSSTVTTAGMSGLLEIDDDGVEQPRQDHNIHPAPVGVIEGRSIGGDMVVEGLALEHQQYEVTPTQVLGGRDVEDDRHQGPDVLDADSLSVEVADGGSIKHASSRLLDLDLGGGDVLLKGCEGSDEVGWSGAGS